MGVIHYVKHHSSAMNVGYEMNMGGRGCDRYDTVSFVTLIFQQPGIYSAISKVAVSTMNINFLKYETDEK